jgi:hypothetical protein
VLPLPAVRNRSDLGTFTTTTCIRRQWPRGRAHQGNGPGAAVTAGRRHSAAGGGAPRRARRGACRPLATVGGLVANRATGCPWRVGPVVRPGSRMAPPSSAASRAVRPGKALLALATSCVDWRMTTRRFPPPWRAEKMPGGYVVRDANDQALAYVYSRANKAEAMQAKVLTDDEARRVAVNIARLPVLLRHGE